MDTGFWRQQDSHWLAGCSTYTRALGSACSSRSLVLLQQAWLSAPLVFSPQWQERLAFTTPQATLL